MYQSLSDALFPSQARRAILALLIRDQLKTTVSDLARKASLTPRAVRVEVEKLCEVGLLSSESHGNADWVAANRAHPAVPLLRKLLSLPEDFVSDLAQSNVKESLCAWGAPVDRTRKRRHFGLEDTILKALVAARREGLLLRVLLVVVAKNESAIDWLELKQKAHRLKLKAELGWLLELAGDLLGNQFLHSQAQVFVDRRRKSLQFFPEAQTRFERELAELRSPPRARRWGFLMNHSEESLRAFLEKHYAPIEAK